MADPRSPDAGDDIGLGAERGSPPGMPRWVKVAGLVVLVMALLLVVVLLVGGGGGHGPQRHASGVDGGREPSTVTLSLG